MDLRVVRYFLAVVDAGSLSAASRSLLVAQPSLSRQLQRFEAGLGLGLFDRSGKRLVLTAAGRSFLPIARDLARRADLASAAAQAMSDGAVAHLTVAAAPATVTDIIAPYIVRGGVHGLVSNVHETSPDRVYQALADGSADVAVGTRVPPKGLRSRVVGHAYLWAQCHDSDPLAARDQVTLAELVERSLIVMTPDQGVRRMFDDAVSHAGLTYEPLFETASTYVAQALAAAGRGVCILSDDARFGLSAMPIVGEAGELTITLHGVWDPLHFAATAIEESLDSLTGFIGELYPPTR
jgi:LysR family transcriptional regulator, benzoate and cis,cis-muconate-responsive activator of ben and cat genes